MELAQFIATFPRVYHASSALAWPSIERHGLLSTARLLDVFDVDSTGREELLSRPRPRSTALTRHGLPPAVIRDQKPMKFLDEKIEPGHSVSDFLAAINSRVFFWPTRERLERLRNAREYRSQAQVVLHVDTCRLVERYEDQIQLCRFNSGAITQRNHPMRSRESWMPIRLFPYEEYRSRYGGSGALAEVTVLDAVPDVLELTVKVEHISN